MAPPAWSAPILKYDVQYAVDCDSLLPHISPSGVPNTLVVQWYPVLR